MGCGENVNVLQCLRQNPGAVQLITSHISNFWHYLNITKPALSYTKYNLDMTSTESASLKWNSTVLTISITWARENTLMLKRLLMQSCGDGQNHLRLREWTNGRRTSISITKKHWVNREDCVHHSGTSRITRQPQLFNALGYICVIKKSWFRPGMLPAMQFSVEGFIHCYFSHPFTVPALSHCSLLSFVHLNEDHLVRLWQKCTSLIVIFQRYLALGFLFVGC